MRYQHHISQLHTHWTGLFRSSQPHATSTSKRATRNSTVTDTSQLHVCWVSPMARNSTNHLLSLARNSGNFSVARNSKFVVVLCSQLRRWHVSALARNPTSSSLVTRNPTAQDGLSSRNSASLSVPARNSKGRVELLATPLQPVSWHFATGMLAIARLSLGFPTIFFTSPSFTSVASWLTRCLADLTYRRHCLHSGL